MAPNRLREEEILRRLDAMIASHAIDEELVNALVAQSYNRGLKKGRSQFKIDFLPNQRAVKFLQRYTFDQVKGLNDEMRKTLRSELGRAFLNDAPPSEIARVLKDKLEIFSSRARMITRTELNRAENFGHFQTGVDAEKTGLELEKEWYNPAPDSEICKELAGTRVPMDGKWKYDGKTFEMPPGHPNCRSRLLIVQKDVKNPL